MYEIISVTYSVSCLFFSLLILLSQGPPKMSGSFLPLRRWRKRWPKCAPMMRGVTILLKQYFETVESGNLFCDIWIYYMNIYICIILFWAKMSLCWAVEIFGACFSARNNVYNWRITSWYQMPCCFLWWRLSQLPCLCFPRLWVVVRLYVIVAFNISDTQELSRFLRFHVLHFTVCCFDMSRSPCRLGGQICSWRHGRRTVVALGRSWWRNTAGTNDIGTCSLCKGLWWVNILSFFAEKSLWTSSTMIYSMFVYIYIQLNYICIIVQ